MNLNSANFSVIIMCVMAAPALSQTAAFGIISGNITDSSGAVVPNAHVIVRNTATGIARSLTTNGSGLFSAPNLVPGEYEVSAVAAGFAKELVSNVVLSVGSEQVLNFTMRIGDLNQTVEADATGQSVDLAASAMNEVLGAETVRELPLNGRDWSQLLALQAGISQVEVHSAGGDQTGNGKQYTVSGGRPTENNYLLNGVSINDYANAGPGSILGDELGVDAIQEFSILTSTASAEYGRSSAGVINAVVRSGGNALHGSLYEFLRNSALDARNFFDVTHSPPDFRRNQYGATVGGPVRRNRTFYFADYEGLRESLASTTISDVPSESAREGRLSTGAVTISPAIRPFLAIYPLPNGPLLGKGDTGEYIFASPAVSSENYGVGRVDHQASKRDSVSAAYYFDTALQSAPDEFNNKDVSGASGNQALAFQESHIWGPELVNSFRAGFTRTTSASGLATTIRNPALEDSALGFDPGRYIGLIQVPGLTDFSGGLNGIQNFVFAWNSYQAYDDIFLTRGRNSFKAGANFERDQENYRSPFQPNGLFQFGSLAAFLEAQPTEFQAQLPGTNTERGIRQDIAGAYIQDDFRWRPNFTVNLGLRYEISTVPRDVNGMLANLVNLTDPAPTVGGPLFHNPTLHDFEPRVGLAYDPFHDGRTSLRAAFGIFDVLPLGYLFTTRFNRTPPFFRTGFAANIEDVPGAFPNGAYYLLGPQSLRTIHVQTNPSRPYRMEWNMNVERQLSGSLLMSAAFVGARGLHLPTQDEDEDIALPLTTPSGYYFPPSAPRINPDFGRIAATTWNVNSYYDALQMTLEKNLSHGLAGQASYTFSKSIDTGSNSFSDDEYQTTVADPYPFNRGLNKGLSDFDQRQRFVASFFWDLPVPRRWGHAVDSALSGWRLAGIETIDSGEPFTVILAGNEAGTKSSQSRQTLGQRPDFIDGPGCENAITGNPNQWVNVSCFAFPAAGTLGNLGRNALLGPGIAELDLSLAKTQALPKLSERVRAQFRAEFFNVLNHANFLPPPVTTYTIYNTSGNLIANPTQLTATSTTSRQIEFALKLLF